MCAVYLLCYVKYYNYVITCLCDDLPWNLYMTRLIMWKYATWNILRCIYVQWEWIDKCSYIQDKWVEMCFILTLQFRHTCIKPICIHETLVLISFSQKRVLLKDFASKHKLKMLMSNTSFEIGKL